MGQAKVWEIFENILSAKLQEEPGRIQESKEELQGIIHALSTRMI